MPSGQPEPAPQTIKLSQLTKFDSSGHQDSSHVVDVDTHLLTPQEVATRLGVSERWVRDHATRRFPRIPAVKLGPLLRFRLSDLEDFLIANRVPVPSKFPLAGV
jgi:excisionase family DNA binding protein